MKSILCAALLSLASPACAATFEDPTWPCLQRKMDTLSLGLMWPHPVSENSIRADLQPDGQELIDTLLLRRVELEDAEALVADFASAHPDLSVDDLGHIFRGVFDKISSDRSTLIKGIERYSLQQIALSEAVDDTRAKMASLMEADNPDFDLVDELEEKLDWDERVFRDRAQSLTYVCETPVLLEKRAYAIAQILLQHAP